MEVYSEISPSHTSYTEPHTQERPKTALTMKEMYMVIDENSNWEWEKLNYKVPRRYQSAKSVKKNLPKKDIERTSYLDEIETLGKKIPGVGQYKVEVEGRKSFSKWDGKYPKRKTIIAEMFEKSKRCPTPGPGSYFKRKSQKNLGSQKNHRNKSVVIDRTSYLNEVEFLAGSSPGIGQYNLATNILIPSFKSNRPSRPNSSKLRPKMAKMSVINPIIDGTFSKSGFIKKLRPQSGIIKSTFDKQKRFTVSKDKIFAPAPNKYRYQKCVNSTLIHNKSIYY